MLQLLRIHLKYLEGSDDHSAGRLYLACSPLLLW
jgi:hypothetical protein